MKFKVKLYCKVLQLVQSESTQKSLGMNLKAIYHPKTRMAQVLKESAEKGAFRIENTYIAETIEGEKQLLGEDFFKDAIDDLDLAQEVISKIDGICWKVHLGELPCY